MLYFGQVVSHGRFLCRLGKADALKPSHVTEGPGLGAAWWPLSLAQQELAQPIAGAVLILYCGLSGPHQIAQGLVRRIGYPDRRELLRAERARQLTGVATVGLDAVTGSHRDQRRGDNFTRYAAPSQFPVKYITGRSRFVAHS